MASCKHTYKGIAGRADVFHIVLSYTSCLAVISFYGLPTQSYLSYTIIILAYEDECDARFLLIR